MEGKISTVETLTGSLTPIKTLTGKLTNEAALLTGKLAATATLTGKLIKNNAEINGSLIIPVQRDEEIDTYTGEYIVTPKPFTDQTLYTSDLIMRHNVLVYKIPYYETSNESGYTIYIGGE